MTDLVYLVRFGESNDELRLSLRSLVNLPHDRVWFVGYMPTWVHGVGHIAGNRHRTKPLNVFDNVRLACEHPDVSDDVVLMNDDFIILEPVTPKPYIRGSLADHLALVETRSDAWARSLRHTAAWIADRDIPEPRSFELHVPFPVSKTKMADALAEVGGYGYPFPPQWRTVYGNLHVGEADQLEDCKLKRDTNAPAGPMLSTTDKSLRRVESVLRGMFPDPSPYEK